MMLLRLVAQEIQPIPLLIQWVKFKSLSLTVMCSVLLFAGLKKKSWPQLFKSWIVLVPG